VSSWLCISGWWRRDPAAHHKGDPLRAVPHRRAVAVRRRRQLNLGKHDCATPVPTAAGERDAALAGVSSARPDAVRAALLIITDTARRYETFSANSCRIEMDIADVPGPAIGAAFGQAVRDGIIRRDGYVASSKGNTHGHEIKQWRSLIWRPRQATA
jgi:hypothetical protein